MNKNLAIANRSLVSCAHNTSKAWLNITPWPWNLVKGHSKRNHWQGHTRLSSSRVIWRWILLWPWNVGQRSLKVIESGTIWKLGYGFLFAFHNNYGNMFSHFGDIQCQKWRHIEDQVRGRSGSLKMALFDRPYATFYWSVIVNIALSCTIFEFFDVG